MGAVDVFLSNGTIEQGGSGEGYYRLTDKGDYIVQQLYHIDAEGSRVFRSY